jgi:DNA-binding transcriptional LysR family regulator
MLDNLHLDDIALFAAVAEAGSFVAAAKRLRQPKSTVSRRLQVLELGLGLRLIERTTRRLKLTEAGAAFFERVQPALQALAEAASDARGSQREPTGLVRMATAVGLATPGFTRVLADYLARHPRVSLELELSDRRVDIVAEGFDLALRAGPLEDSAFLQRKLGFARTVLVAAPALLARHSAPRTPADLRRLPALAPPRQGAWALTRGGERVELPAQGPLRVDNLLMLLQAARHGIGVARLPRFLCREDLAAGRLLALLPDWETAGYEVHVLLPSRQPTSAVRALVTHLEERAADLFPD